MEGISSESGNPLRGYPTRSGRYDVLHVETEAGWLGRVHLPFTKRKYLRPRAKFAAVFWSCCHADRVVSSDEKDAADRPAGAFAVNSSQ